VHGRKNEDGADNAPWLAGAVESSPVPAPCVVCAALRGGRRSSMQKYKMWETQFRFKMQHFDRAERVVDGGGDIKLQGEAHVMWLRRRSIQTVESKLFLFCFCRLGGRAIRNLDKSFHFCGVARLGSGPAPCRLVEPALHDRHQFHLRRQFRVLMQNRAERSLLVLRTRHGTVV
jgi:hypothetical protein